MRKLLPLFLSLMMSVPTLLQAEFYELDLEAEGEPYPVRLWVPPNLPVVYGVLVHGDGASRVPFMPVYQAMAANLGFAVMGTGSYTPEAAELFQTALDHFAEVSGREELRHVPFIGMGNSNGAATILKIGSTIPERTIALAPAVGYNRDIEDPGALGDVPVIFGLGEWDSEHWPNGAVERLFPQYRKAGALWALITEEETGHTGTERRLQDLFLPFLQRAVEMRYPKDADPREGPVELKPIELNNGVYMSYPADYVAGNPGRPNLMYPWGYAGDPLKASYLIDLDIAWLARATATHNRPLDLNADVPGIETSADFEADGYLSPSKVFAPGQPVELRVNAYAAHWLEIQLFNGAQRDGGWQLGYRTDVIRTTRTPAPGVHGYSAVGIKTYDLATHLSPAMRVIVSGGPGRPHVSWEPGTAPVILTEPADVTVKAGQPFTLAAYAAGGPEIRYTWMKDGQPLHATGFDTNILDLTNASEAMAGEYALKVSNPHGEVISKAATVTVEPFAGITFPQVTATGGHAIPAAPAKAEFVAMTNDHGESPAEENTARFRGWWDTYRLYLEIVIEDAEANYGEELIWSNDLVEIFLEGRNEKSPRYGTGANQLVVTRNPDRPTEGIFHPVPNGVVRTVTEHDDGSGYTVRLAIPWLDLAKAPRAGDFLGFDLAAAFVEGGKRSWFTDRNVAWEGPHRLGTVRLVD